MSLPQHMEAALRNLAGWRPQAEPLDYVWYWYDWNREILTVSLTNGEDAEVSVRAEQDAAIDVARFGVSYNVEALSGGREAREWVSMNESVCVELYEKEVGRG